MSAASRHNAAVTNAAFHLRAAVRFSVAPTGNLWVMGECGHILDCVRPSGWQFDAWSERITARKRHRRRCESCPKPYEETTT